MKNDFDNKLTDKGWQSMRAVLDREMPERRKRRPAFWWWLSALILLPAITVGGWWWHSRHGGAPAAAPAPAELPAPKKPVAASEMPAPGDAIHNEIPGGQMKQSPVRREMPQSNPAAGAAHGSIEAYAVPKNYPAENTGATPNYPKQQLATQPVAAVNSENSASKTATDKQIAGSTKKEALPSATQLPLFPQPVASLYGTAPRFNTARTESADPVKRATDTGSRLTFGIAGGIHAERLNALGGFSAGAVVDWQPARKWGLRSGLQYARYQPAATERPVITLEDNAYADATGNFDVVFDNTSIPTGSSLDSQDNPVLVPVERITRLEMPLLAYWQPLRPLRVFAGVTGSYNLSAKASVQSFANNKVYLADDLSAVDNLSDLTTRALPRWNINLMLGAGVRIGKHFELDAFYRPGFAKTGDSNNTSGFSTPGQNDPDAGFQPRSVDASSWFFLNGILFF